MGWLHPIRRPLSLNPRLAQPASRTGPVVAGPAILLAQTLKVKARRMTAGRL